AGGDCSGTPVGRGGAAQAIAAAGARADAGVAVWSIGPRHALWLRGFAAVAPAEQRRYVGWSGCAAEPAEADDEAAWAQALPAVLARFTLPPARPFAPADGPGAPNDAVVTVEPTGALLDPELAPDDGEAVARALCAGGDAVLADPHDAALPAWWGRMLSWLPPDERVRPRAGLLAAHAAAAAPAPAAEPQRNLYHYLHRCWQHRARRPWRLVLELRAFKPVSLADLFEELTGLAAAWEHAADLEAYLIRSGALAQQEIQAAHAHAPAPLRGPDVGDAGRLWNRILHYWGRGFLGARARGEVAERLAGVLARRITVDHLLALDTPERADAERYLRRLRFEALLTVRDARTLRTALARVLPSLEVHRERA